jgi:beta-glucanase (GH16 family)
VGAYCLGGCDPQYSNSLKSCVPAPQCSTQDYKLTTLDGITPNTEYLGDASKANWVSSGTPLEAPGNDSIILTLSEDGQSASGTLLASTHYVWYGKISARMKSSRGVGVVSAFILLSDVKDEIDFEFVGTDLQIAQSNFYFQGITNCKCSGIVLSFSLMDADENGKNLTVSKGDTFSDWHIYEVDWQPDQLTWSVDGTVMRKLEKSATFNKTDNQYHYPQTPARVELSLWPAGLPKNGQGTIAWAGGLIDWNTQDVKSNGYYYAMYSDVNVQCYQTPPGAKVSGSTSYSYTGTNGVQSDISLTNDPTVLKSLLGTGTDMSKDFPKAAKPSGTQSSTKGAATSQVATVPGLTGAGPGTDGSRGGSNTGNSGSNQGGSNGGNQASSAAGPASTGIGGFTQGDQPSSKSSSEAPKNEAVMKGSAFAAMVAFIGMLII